ncbi:MAG: FGGY-family carbohydrate kinase [Chloroflexi bacterium]|nr:FGGY-family carbohydrate kinase [Chloroflexota bacterium]
MLTDQYILAIDLGTSGPKVALVSAEGDVVDYEFEETPLILFPNGGAEQNPDDWWQAIKKATHRLLAKHSDLVADIIAVVCTTQWSGTVAVDQHANHLMNAIIWMDSRGARYAKEVTDGWIKVEGYGVEKLATWLWLSGGIPTHSGKDSISHILYIKNVILHWVTDNRDITRIKYDDRLLKLAGVERDKLPDLKRAVDILGTLTPEAAKELGLPENVQVVMGLPDTHSAAIGSGAVRDFEAHLYVGTSSWLICHVPFKKVDLFHNMSSLPSAIPNRYLLLNEQETAGACLTYLRDNLIFSADELNTHGDAADAYKTFDRIVERVPPGSDKLIFTPWLYGERTPVDDHSVRSGFFNQSLKTTRAHLIRSVFEGVAYNSRWLLGCVEEFIGKRLEAINMIGGGANSNVWCQIYADVLNRTIRQVKDPIQANLRGAAFLALVALGHLTFDDVSSRVQIAHTYQPNPANRKIYDELFAEFVNLYNVNKKIYQRLNRVE